jgi:hypothetical protein
MADDVTAPRFVTALLTAGKTVLNWFGTSANGWCEWTEDGRKWFRAWDVEDGEVNAIQVVAYPNETETAYRQRVDLAMQKLLEAGT